MMKKLICFVLLLTAISLAQNISVVKVEQITTKSQGEFYYPQFSFDGSKIFFTSESYKGLWYYDAAAKAIVNLNNLHGAGYQPVISKDGNKVMFRVDDYSEGIKKSAMVLQDVNSKSLVTIEEKTRGLSAPIHRIDDKVVYTKADEVNAVLINSAAKLNKNEITDMFAYVDNSNIVLAANGSKKILSPLGKGNYIWSSVSPDKTKLLFTLAGKGTFISDLNGTILYEIGYANAPVWSPDGKWILYMVDKDDGTNFISSDIFISSADDNKKFQLTNEPDRINMYPLWSSKGDKVVFNSAEGEIILLELKIDSRNDSLERN
jgi:Tol biopolymer transport system component